LDEVGKPTGGARQIPVDPEIEKLSKPLVAKLLTYFVDPPLDLKSDGKPDGENLEAGDPAYRQTKGKPRDPTRKDFKKAGKIVEREALQREVYQLGGVRFDVEDRTKKHKPVDVYDELVGLV